MDQDNVSEIVDLCLAIDTLAAEMYTAIAAACEPGELRRFWTEMAEDERHHARFWTALQDAARQRKLPPIFDDSAAVRADLTRVLDTAKVHYARWESSNTLANAFLLACRLELSMLHPAFSTLFYFGGTLLVEADTVDLYDRHVSRFVTALHTHCQTAPELELLADTLQRLWRDNRMLSQQATHDELTGLLNRRGFYLFARQLAYFSQRNGTHIGVLMLDVDNFKAINDRYGHPTGDIVLKNVANTLKTRLRRSDILGRYGGEEFVVFLPDVHQDALSQVAESIRRNVERTGLDGMRVTVSIGATQGVIRKDPERELKALIADADSSLNSANRTGKNRVIFHSPTPIAHCGEHRNLRPDSASDSGTPCRLPKRVCSA